MTNAEFFLGLPVDFNGLFKIYPPKVKDIVANKFFSFFEKIVTTSIEDIEDEFTEQKKSLENLLTPLEYLLGLCYNSEEIERVVKEGFFLILHEDVTFLYTEKKILVGNLEESLKSAKTLSDLKFIDENNYFDFQNCVRSAIGRKLVVLPDPDENPRVKAMKAKARLRDRVKEKNQEGINLTASIASICCMNLGLNPLNVGEISYAALNVLSSFYQNKEKYQLDIDSLLAGADSNKVKPVYWIKNLED